MVKFLQMLHSLEWCVDPHSIHYWSKTIYHISRLLYQFLMCKLMYYVENVGFGRTFVTLEVT